MVRTTLLLFIFLTACLQNAISQKKAVQPDFYETDRVQDIRITFPMDNWRYMLDSLRFNGDRLLEGMVEINGEQFDSAGVQYRGTKSFAPGAARNPFNILLDYKKEGQKIQGYSTLKLSNALRDPSLVREVLGYEIARDYMPAPRANYARLTVNGEYYGLLVNIESVQDPQFRMRYFGTGDNPLFKPYEVLNARGPAGCKNNIYGALEYDEMPACYEVNFEKFNTDSYDQLIKLTKVLNMEVAKIESVLDVDVTLWMHAFNDVLVNLSSYSGQNSVNYYLYQNPKGQFVPIIWDMNLAFGSFKNIGTGSDLRSKQLIELDPLLHADSPTKPLISKLLADPTNHKIYVSHLRSILEDWFVSGKYAERAKAMQSLIRTDFINDPGKFYTVEEFNESLEKVTGKQSKIPGIMWLMEKRTEFLKKNEAVAVFPPDITEVSVVTRKPMSSKQVEDFRITAKADKFPKRVTLYYRLGGEVEFQKMSMLDDGKSDDGVANNNVFGAIVVPRNDQRNIEYYIVAENVSMFSYSPANYMWERHRTSLEELNK